MEANDTLILLSLTQAEINAITSPDTGGMLYNSTTNTIEVYNGSSWKVLGSGSGDLLSTNNLSYVANAATALGNLSGEPTFAKNTGFNKDLGTIAGTVLEGNTTTITGAESTKLAFITVTQAVDLDTIESDTSANNAKNSYPSADATKVAFITVTQAVDLDTIESDVTANNLKVTNATHTGEVTGSGALTVDSTAISNKVSVTAVAGMEVLVNDAGTLKKADASDFLGTATEEFYFQRVETIDNSTGTPVEYFTEVQGGTEITNTATYTGGTYLININFVCLNTSTSGSVKVDIQVGGTSVFADPYEVEPKDNDNIYYVGISKRIPITAGVKAVDVNLTNVGSGTGRIFEANVTITKK